MGDLATDEIRAFFATYARLFDQALAGEDVLGELKALYAEEFIAAVPAGVRAGRLDDTFEAVMAQGYERYREIGTKAMDVVDVDVHDIDETHWLARVSWDSVYERPDRPEIHIPFDVSYFLERRDDRLRVFGWVSGDEQALLEDHGLSVG